MEFTEEIRDRIIETARDVKHICEQLDNGKETFKEHRERIRQLELNQQLLTGKAAIIIMLVGAGVLFVTNVIMNLIMRLWK